MKRQVDYFEKPGPGNTSRCIEIIAELAHEGVKDFVVASTTGATGVLAAQALKEAHINLVVVGHSVGLKGTSEDEFLPENQKKSTRWGGGSLKGRF